MLGGQLERLRWGRAVGLLAAGGAIEIITKTSDSNGLSDFLLKYFILTARFTHTVYTHGLH